MTPRHAMGRSRPLPPTVAAAVTWWRSLPDSVRLRLYRRQRVRSTAAIVRAYARQHGNAGGTP